MTHILSHTLSFLLSLMLTSSHSPPSPSCSVCSYLWAPCKPGDRRRSSLVCSHWVTLQRARSRTETVTDETFKEREHDIYSDRIASSLHFWAIFTLLLLCALRLYIYLIFNIYIIILAFSLIYLCFSQPTLLQQHWKFSLCGTISF